MPQNVADSPYTDANLGGVVQAYRVPLPARLTAGIVSTLGGGFALLSAGLLAFGVRPSDLGMTIGFDLVLALPLALLGAFLIWRCIQLWTLRATVYEGGVDVRTVRGGRRVAWGDVAGFRCDAARPAHIAVLVFGLLFCWIIALAYLLSWLRPRLRYGLVLASGETLALPRALVGRTSLAATVDLAVARQQLAALLSRYAHGEALSFGAVTLAQAGLHTHKGLLPWTDLHLLTRTATGFVIYRTGAQAAWTTVRLTDVLSPGLFAALVAAILDQTSRQAVRDAV